MIVNINSKKIYFTTRGKCANCGTTEVVMNPREYHCKFCKSNEVYTDSQLSDLDMKSRSDYGYQ